MQKHPLMAKLWFCQEGGKRQTGRAGILSRISILPVLRRTSSYNDRKILSLHTPNSCFPESRGPGGRERLHRCEQMSRWRCAPPLPDGPGDLEAQGLSRPARGGSEVEGSLARGQRNLCSGQAGRVRRALEPGSPSLSGHRPLLPGALWPVLGPSPTWACCPTTGRAWFLPCPRHRQGGKSCACSPA